MADPTLRKVFFLVRGILLQNFWLEFFMMVAAFSKLSMLVVYAHFLSFVCFFAPFVLLLDNLKMTWTLKTRGTRVPTRMAAVIPNEEAKVVHRGRAKSENVHLNDTWKWIRRH